MNNEKLATVKSKLKKYTPAIRTALEIIGVTAGIAAACYSKQNTIRLTADDREELKTGDTNLTYHIDGCDYVVRHVGPDHPRKN